jgi:cytochrome P450
MQERRVALSEGRAVPQDLLGILLTAADESGQAMTDEELWEDVHDVMGAGTVLCTFLHFFSNQCNSE